MTVNLRALAILILVTGLCAPSITHTQVTRDTKPGVPAAQIGTGSISGMVIVGGTGLPARGARVSLSGQDNIASRSTLTDDTGRFAFGALPAGRYNLNASKTGFIGVTYGQSRPGRAGTPIELADGGQFAARLQVFRGGVLTGPVLDENGEAIPRTSVRTLRYVIQSGQRTLQQSGSGSTDDRGIYRVFGLQPGDYVITATPPTKSSLTDTQRLRAELDSLRQRADAVGRSDEAAAREMTARVASLEAQMGGMPEEQPTGYAPVY